MAVKVVKTPNSKAKVSNLKIQRHTTGSETTELIATWDWNYKNTSGFEYTWEYRIIDSWISASSGTTDKDHKNALYTPPENAVMVRFSVKPVSTTYKVNDKDVNYWVISQPTIAQYNPSLVSVKLETPSAPSLSLNQYVLTASVDYENENAASMLFIIYDADRKTAIGEFQGDIFAGKSSIQCRVVADGRYIARCIAVPYESQSLQKYLRSDPSPYSGEIIAPPNSALITKIEATSTTSVKILFDTSRTMYSTATSYNVEYTENKDNFNHSDSVNSVTINVVPGVSYILVNGLEEGKHWYFRVQSANDNGSSVWSNIVDIVLGSVPNAPTIWSSTNVAIINEPVTLYWTHNATDGSKEQKALLIFYVTRQSRDGSISEWERFEIEVPANIEDDSINTFSYVFYPEIFDNNGSSDVISLVWSCKTKGIIDVYSPESVSNRVNFYPKPEVILRFGKTINWYWDPLDLIKGNIMTTEGEIKEYYEEDPFTLSRLPLYIEAQVLPLLNNRPVECYLAIYATDDYQSLNHIGETIWITKNTEIWSKTLTAMTDESRNIYNTFITAKDAILENNQTYRFFCRVITDSGLTADIEKYFTVNFEEDEFTLNASIGYDPDKVSTYIQPYCIGEDDEIVENVYLSVYRKNFDGSFVEIADEIDNTANTTVVDPHPTLKTVMYRISAYSLLSGKITFTDLVGYPIPETAIVIQWDESWESFNIETPDSFSSPVQSTSMLKLPYNVDTSESNALDSKMVEYIGRKHPVSYYGTQVGQKISLKCDIDAEDKETVYQLRRLAIWPGDVYIREPSGNGYHAQISITFSTTHCNVVIPVSIEAVRVEGGV